MPQREEKEEKNTLRETEKQRDRETERQIVRETERQRDRLADGRTQNGQKAALLAGVAVVASNPPWGNIGQQKQY